VELDEHRKGGGWIVPWVASRCERNDIRAVVVDARSPAASLLDELTAAGVRATTTSAADMAAACGRFYDGVVASPAQVLHIDQPQMSRALGFARKRELESGWAWSRKNSASDITPVVAATPTLWGAQNSKVKRPTRSGNMRVVVMS